MGRVANTGPSFGRPLLTLSDEVPAPASSQPSASGEAALASAGAALQAGVPLAGRDGSGGVVSFQPSSFKTKSQSSDPGIPSQLLTAGVPSDSPVSAAAAEVGPAR